MDGRHVACVASSGPVRCPTRQYAYAALDVGNTPGNTHTQGKMVDVIARSGLTSGRCGHCLVHHLTQALHLWSRCLIFPHTASFFRALPHFPAHCLIFHHLNQAIPKRNTLLIRSSPLRALPCTSPFHQGTALVASLHVSCVMISSPHVSPHFSSSKPCNTPGVPPHVRCSDAHCLGASSYNPPRQYTRCRAARVAARTCLGARLRRINRCGSPQPPPPRPRP